MRSSAILEAINQSQLLCSTQSLYNRNQTHPGALGSSHHGNPSLEWLQMVHLTFPIDLYLFVNVVYLLLCDSLNILYSPLMSVLVCLVANINMHECMLPLWFGWALYLVWHYYSTSGLKICSQDLHFYSPFDVTAMKLLRHMYEYRWMEAGIPLSTATPQY